MALVKVGPVWVVSTGHAALQRPWAIAHVLKDRYSTAPARRAGEFDAVTLCGKSLTVTDWQTEVVVPYDEIRVKRVMRRLQNRQPCGTCSKMRCGIPLTYQINPQHTLPRFIADGYYTPKELEKVLDSTVRLF